MHTDVYNCQAIPERVVAAQTQWNAAQLQTICSLWLGSLKPLPPDPTNRLADNPEAAAFGRRLFFDSRLSADQTVSCATCHKPELSFTDGRAIAIGVSLGKRNTPTVIGTAYSPWFFWDGHKDSQWSQALEPLETPFEHDFSRQALAELIAGDAQYRAAYESLVGPLPNPKTEAGVTDVFVVAGKAIAAYERTLMFTPSRFDRYVVGLLGQDEVDPAETLNADEQAGLALFIDQAECVNCHNGPLLTNNSFHNTAVFTKPENGRYEGAQQVLDDEFNCLSQYSDDRSACAELRFIKTDVTETLGSFKTPTLRNISLTAPYMHAGQLATLTEVMEHYNTAPDLARPPSYGHNELNPINLTDTQLAQLVAFLETLTSPVTDGEDR